VGVWVLGAVVALLLLALYLRLAGGSIQ